MFECCANFLDANFELEFPGDHLVKGQPTAGVGTSRTLEAGTQCVAVPEMPTFEGTGNNLARLVDSRTASWKVQSLCPFQSPLTPGMMLAQIGAATRKGTPRVNFWLARCESVNRNADPSHADPPLAFLVQVDH